MIFNDRLYEMESISDYFIISQSEFIRNQIESILYSDGH